MADLANEEKPAIAPPVFVFQKEKAQKRSADGSSAEDGDDSDKDDGGPPVKRERTSSLTQFPPSHSVSKNNVFMPSSLCQSPSGNSDSEPEEKSFGFRLKPPTLIHGQAPSAGVPSQKPKEQQRSVLRPAVLQAPQPKSFILSIPDSNSGTNGVSKSSEGKAEGQLTSRSTAESLDGVSEGTAKSQVEQNSEHLEIKESCSVASESQSGETNYFLQYISPPSSKKVSDNADSGSKFIFGQNMSDRVLSPPKCNESPAEGSREFPAAPGCETTSKDATPEKANSVAESLEESAAAYTKATAKKCLLEKVEVITGEESESNVLQIQCKLFVFDKTSQSWVERGRGLLRLNDMSSTDVGTLQSRLVMRTQGSLRLILNTKLWAQMQIDKASEKSIRITAMDTEDQGVKVFLISASSKDTGQLYAALHHRILALRSRAEQEAETKALAPETEVPPSNEDDSDEDDIAPATGSTPASGPPEAGESAEAPAAGST
ncbi:ran-binding protein 3-like isoform X2 [Brienomyrus brachyistius]|uniref:ran-binding protein 3-like isoform X2 n=1 Tax=Brienomyrus brachyistius TaxID=42636 RepID=UPI0020B36AAD|nr:ran-binding protein 3-like isoform X2 [Brienomyrus brachyistius]